MIRKFLVGYSFFLLLCTSIVLNSAQPITELQQQLQSLQKQLQQLDSSLQAITKAPTEDINIIFEEKLKEIEKDFNFIEITMDPFKDSLETFFVFEWKTKLNPAKEVTAKNNATVLKENADDFLTQFQKMLINIGDMGRYFTKNSINQQNKDSYTQLLNNVQSSANKTKNYVQKFKNRFKESTPSLNNFNPDLVIEIKELFREVNAINSEITQSNIVITEIIRGNGQFTKSLISQQYQKTSMSYQNLKISINEYLPSLRQLINELTESDEKVRKNLETLKEKDFKLEDSKNKFVANLTPLKVYAPFISDTQLMQKWVKLLKEIETYFSQQKERLDYTKQDFQQVPKKNLEQDIQPNFSIGDFISLILKDQKSYFKNTKKLATQLSKRFKPSG